MRPELPIPALEHTVDGRAVTGRGPELVVDDPALGTPIARFAQVDGDQLDAAVRAAGTAFATWGLTTSREERSKHLHRLADALEARREQFVQLIVAEAGTPITLTRALQVDTPLAHLRWYADRAAVDRTESLGRDAGRPRARARSPTTRWGWWPRSRRTTTRCCSRSPSWAPRSPPAAPSC